MFALLVGDVDSCRSGLSGEGGDLHPEPLTQVGVEVGQRLVEQQQLGLGHYGAGQCDALLLPPDSSWGYREACWPSPTRSSAVSLRTRAAASPRCRRRSA